MSATWSSGWLISDFNQLTGRPDIDVITPAQKYARLTKAQNRIVMDIAGICPWILYPKVGYPNMPTLSTTDNQVFTFGTDTNGYAIAPIGRTQIYRTLDDIPSYPMVEGCDYLDEGTQIRIPNDGHYDGTLYWRGISPPPDISDASQPVLFPPASRALISLRAAITFGLEGNSNPQLAAMLTGDYKTLWLNQLLAWRTQFELGGAMGNWTGFQLALAGAPNGVGIPTLG